MLSSLGSFYVRSLSINGRASIVEYLFTTIVITLALLVVTSLASIFGFFILFLGVLIFFSSF